jgi:uncharacterized protein
MTNDSVMLAVFLMALAGSGHCVGMCAPIVSALSVGGKQKFSFLLLYNLGRISTYIILGIISSHFGFFLSRLFNFDLRAVFIIISSALMIAIGLYLADISKHIISKIEKIGVILWKYISPQATKLLPIKNYKSAYIAGIMWGMLPCGLLYSALIWTITAAGNITDAILIMLVFGVGTLPAMMGVGLFSLKTKQYLQKRQVRLLFGIIVIAFAIYQLLFFVFRW